MLVSMTVEDTGLVTGVIRKEQALGGQFLGRNSTGKGTGRQDLFEGGTLS